MPDVSYAFRATAIVALVAVIFASFMAVDRRYTPPETAPLSPLPAPTSHDLSAELRRCSALGAQDAEDAHCVAVWEENRRRFLGQPARPLPLQASPAEAAPAAASRRGPL